mmetsp:Transcript_6011/g.13105  ORF Transcript_6011/g.13105 Transcript_6011/m.13105 type:complete len:200 (-) Transcript_6011:48-647(-)
MIKRSSMSVFLAMLRTPSMCRTKRTSRSAMYVANIATCVSTNAASKTPYVTQCSTSRSSSIPESSTDLNVPSTSSTKRDELAPNISGGMPSSRCKYSLGATSLLWRSSVPEMNAEINVFTCRCFCSASSGDDLNPRRRAGRCAGGCLAACAATTRGTPENASLNCCLTAAERNSSKVCTSELASRPRFAHRPSSSRFRC